MPAESGAGYVQDCEDKFCFGDDGTVAGEISVAVTKSVMSVMEEVAEKTRVMNGVEKSADGELNELYFGAGRDA